MSNVNNPPAAAHVIYLVDATASRAIDGTVYHNTSGYPRYISVVMHAQNQAANSQVSAMCSADAGLVTQLLVSRQTTTLLAVGSVSTSLFFIAVPSYGYYYVLPDVGAFVLDKWIEWT